MCAGRGEVCAMATICHYTKHKAELQRDKLFQVKRIMLLMYFLSYFTPIKVEDIQKDNLGGKKRCLWTGLRSSFYPLDQISSTHVGKPSICIPAILGGLQKEDFLKASAASQERKKPSNGFILKDSLAINKYIKLNVQNAQPAPVNSIF